MLYLLKIWRTNLLQYEEYLDMYGNLDLQFQHINRGESLHRVKLIEMKNFDQKLFVYKQNDLLPILLRLMNEYDFFFNRPSL